MAAGCFSSTLIPYRSEGISVRHTARPSSCCSEVAPNQTPPSAIKRDLLSWKALTVHPIKPQKTEPLRLVAGVQKTLLTGMSDRENTCWLPLRRAPRLSRPGYPSTKAIALHQVFHQTSLHMFKDPFIYCNKVRKAIYAQGRAFALYLKLVNN